MKDQRHCFCSGQALGSCNAIPDTQLPIGAGSHLFHPLCAGSCSFLGEAGAVRQLRSAFSTQWWNDPHHPPDWSLHHQVRAVTGSACPSNSSSTCSQHFSSFIPGQWQKAPTCIIAPAGLHPGAEHPLIPDHRGWVLIRVSALISLWFTSDENVAVIFIKLKYLRNLCRVH